MEERNGLRNVFASLCGAKVLAAASAILALVPRTGELLVVERVT
jgi:hypothetical protein